MDKEIEDIRHKNKMLELGFARETMLLEHNKILERMRISNAENKKAELAHFERKKDFLLFQKQTRRDNHDKRRY